MLTDGTTLKDYCGDIFTLKRLPQLISSNQKTEVKKSGIMATFFEIILLDVPIHYNPLEDDGPGSVSGILICFILFVVIGLFLFSRK